jgi:putative redox protein
VIVRLRHFRGHASDCVSCETNDAKLDVIEREIEFTGTLAADQRERLLSIANRCPVHRTLTSEIEIRTTMK